MWTRASTCSIDALLRRLVLALLLPAACAAAAHPCYEPAMLERFYALRAHEPAWTRREDMQQALQILDGAGAHGLPASEYAVDAAGTHASAARGDAQLTEALLRYLADLHCGRIATAYNRDAVAAKRAAFDPALALHRALHEQRLGELADAAAPEHPLYRRVQQALADLRTRAEAPRHAPPILDRRALIEPDAPFPEADALRQRLFELGEIDQAGPAAPRYTPDLVPAVQAFQERHGLRSDGVLDRATRAALAVPLQQRVHQLELTLERLRWLPRLPPGRVIIVNVPAYRLLAFDSSAHGEEPLGMRVIVGAAVKTPTPLFLGRLTDIELNPYWNVPRSIERGEIIPKAARNPGYLARQGFERVPDGAGGTRLRQRPGPKNALGRIKFVMPNPMNIYLHATPAQELFQRPRRDFSHGCIRVEHPLELAQFALGQPRWNADAVGAAIATGRTQRLTLPAAIPVILMYATAMVDHDGKVRFHEDVYGLDAQLHLALGTPSGPAAK